MTWVAVLPVRGEVFLDARDPSRAPRMSWHHKAEAVVLSLWRERTCAGTFRLAGCDVPDFVDALVTGLSAGYDGAGLARPAGAG